MFRQYMESPIEVSLCAGRQPALGTIATPFDPAVDLLDLLSKVSKLRKHFGLKTNVARDLAQFSARFGRPLTYKLSKLAHYMQSPEKNFSGPLYLCFGFRIRLHLQPQAFAP